VKIKSFCKLFYENRIQEVSQKCDTHPTLESTSLRCCSPNTVRAWHELNQQPPVHHPLKACYDLVVNEPNWIDMGFHLIMCQVNMNDNMWFLEYAPSKSWLCRRLLGNPYKELDQGKPGKVTYHGPSYMLWFVLWIERGWIQRIVFCSPDIKN
jgi:hypothetical protein